MSIPGSGVTTAGIPIDSKVVNNSKAATLPDKLLVLPQYLVPQHLLSRLTYHLTRCRWKPLKNLVIRLFIRMFNVDMSEAAEPDYRAYRHFNHFFTRPLKPGIRTIATGKSVVSPVDGRISQVGAINADNLFQAKHRFYTLESLLAGNREMAGLFLDGAFATLYLSPRDYHRIHMPLDGRLSRMMYVPGRLFAVNARTTRVVHGLFARNERVISLFDTPAGPMALVMVGAINVGSLETAWAGEITPGTGREIQSWDYNDRSPAIELARGEEMGRFNMGSTVILLFGKGRINWLAGIQAETGITLGMPLAEMLTVDSGEKI